MTERKDDLTPDERELLGSPGSSLEALRNRHADCPSPELLLAAHSNVLPEEIAGGVTAHVAKCRFCQILLEDLTSEDLLSATEDENLRIRERVMSPLIAPMAGSQKRNHLFSGWFWPAGSIALAAAAIAIAFLLLPRRNARNSGTQPAAEVHQLPAGGSQLGLEWEKLPIKLEASLILVPRGEPHTTQQKYAAQLSSALVFYRDDNFAQAAERLAEVTREFPQGQEAQLYLGVSELKLGQNSEAIAPLEEAQKVGRGPLSDDATWYLALAHQRLGNSQEALAGLNQLCNGKSTYKSKACSAVQRSGNR